MLKELCETWCSWDTVRKGQAGQEVHRQRLFCECLEDAVRYLRCTELFSQIYIVEEFQIYRTIETIIQLVLAYRDSTLITLSYWYSTCIIMIEQVLIHYV